MKPFPHQEAIAKLVQEHDKGIFDIACGCGKSYSMVLASKNFFVTVVFAPTKNLVSQLANTFEELSDSKVFIINSDNQINLTQLRRAKTYKKKSIVIVANYQSVHVVKETCESLNIRIDAVFLDEAHNVTSDKKKSIFHRTRNGAKEDTDCDSNSDIFSLSDSCTDSYTDSFTESDSGYSSFGNGSEGITIESLSNSTTDSTESTERFTMSDISALVSKKTFSFTATPTKTMIKHPEIYGPVLLRYTFAQGVIDGHVKNIETVIECYGKNDNTCLDAGYDRLIPAVTRYIESGEYKRVIIYTSRVRETLGKKTVTVHGLQENRSLFPDGFKLHAVTADTPLVERNAIFDTFRKMDTETHDILSCMTISEGIDLPSCDAVVILDSSKSVVKIIQRALRACRLTTEERKAGEWRPASVFYPINVPESSLVELIEAGANQAIDVLTKHVHRHDFEFAMAVVHFLKQDLELEPLFDYVCRGVNKGGKKDAMMSETLSENKGKRTATGRVTFQFDGMFEWSPEKFQESSNYITTNLRVVGLEERFEENLEKLRVFVQENNRLPSQTANNPEEKQLGVWCNSRRHDYKVKRLSQERIKDLERIQLWSWDPTEDQYQKSLQDLKKFIKQNNRLPSQTAKNPDEKQLGTWCNNRRNDYKKNQLSPEKIKELESIQQWSWDPFEDQYQKSLQDLKKFIKQNNRLPSKEAKNPEEKQLGSWCQNRRQDYKKNQMSHERVQKLERISHWSWDPIEDQYQKSLEDLKKFIKDNNRLPSNKAKNPEEKQLGSWCQSRRQEYKKNQLSPEKIKDLESIPQWSWDPFEDQYQKSLQDLKKFIKDNNKLPSSTAKNPDEKQIGSWCSSRRKNYKNKKLSEERIKELESLPLWYWSNDTKTTKSIVLPTNSKHDKTSAIKNPRQLSGLSEYHKRFKTLSSKNLHKEFQEDPELFNEYHKVAEKNWEGFKSDDRPVNMASRLVDRIHKQVNMPLNIADFGAGVGTLKELISAEHTLTGFDHISVKDWIIARDMRDTGLESASQDICVFSMSLWGSNWEEYIAEATRVLKSNGYIVIINGTRKWFLNEEGQVVDPKDTRVGKVLVQNGLVIAKISGLDTIFTTCIAVKPYLL